MQIGSGSHSPASLLSGNARGPKLVQRAPGHHRRKEGGGFAYLLTVNGEPAHHGIGDDVLRVPDGAQQPVGDTEQPRTLLHELTSQLVSIVTKGAVGGCRLEPRLTTRHEVLPVRSESDGWLPRGHVMRL